MSMKKGMPPFNLVSRAAVRDYKERQEELLARRSSDKFEAFLLATYDTGERTVAILHPENYLFPDEKPSISADGQVLDSQTDPNYNCSVAVLPSNNNANVLDYRERDFKVSLEIQE